MSVGEGQNDRKLLKKNPKLNSLKNYQQLPD